MKNNSDLPYDLKREIYRNGRAMQAFYQLPQSERNAVLEQISKTNESIKEKTGEASDKLFWEQKL